MFFQNYEIEAERRDELKKYLADNGVGTLIQWNGQPVHSIKELGFKGEGLPYTEKMYQKCLMIPMNTSLNDEDVKYVIEKINNFMDTNKINNLIDPNYFQEKLNIQNIDSN